MGAVSQPCTGREGLAALAITCDESPAGITESTVRVAKLYSKVGSRRTTRIRNLVVLTVPTLPSFYFHITCNLAFVVKLIFILK